MKLLFIAERVQVNNERPALAPYFVWQSVADLLSVDVKPENSTLYLESKQVDLNNHNCGLPISKANQPVSWLISEGLCIRKACEAN